jgi:hypothetical protein
MNLRWLRRGQVASLGLLGLGAGTAVVAQSLCPPPVLLVVCHQHEVGSAGAVFAPQLTLRVQPASQCAPNERYGFREAEVTLIRGRRPLLATKLVHTAAVDLTDFAPLAQPGDRIHFFVSFQNLYLVGATGEQRPYARAVPPPPGLAASLTRYAARGIAFTWSLTTPRP